MLMFMRMENGENSRTNRTVRQWRRGRGRRGADEEDEEECKKQSKLRVFLHKRSYCFRVEELRRYCQETCYKLAYLGYQ